MSDAPTGNPGDILNWPMLKIVYRTDADRIAALLPPGIEPGADPHVNLTIYNFPVPDVPEYGIVTSVNADYNGIAGEYTLGYGIDQESAIFISQETNGQPKYPCETHYYRFMNKVVARCTHQGYTFVEFEGESTGQNDPQDEFARTHNPFGLCRRDDGGIHDWFLCRYNPPRIEGNALAAGNTKSEGRK